jgi:4-hydroxy-2-oxoheptanedioate aldolase
MRPNTMKTKLYANQPTLGVSLTIPSAQIVEMVGYTGFDWVLIDCEHGSMSDETVEAMVFVAESVGIAPIARPAFNREELILRVMDRGCMGVQVPHVSTAEEAQEAVASVKYPPQGIRSFGFPRHARYGIGASRQEYVDWSNRETLVCIQIEDKEGLRNLDAILKVNGVDVFFIGPQDLSQDLGYPSADHPEFKGIAKEAFGKIRAAGKIAGSSTSDAIISEHLSMGVHYLYTHTPRLIATAGKALLDKVHKAKR